MTSTVIDEKDLYLFCSLEYLLQSQLFVFADILDLDDFTGMKKKKKKKKKPYDMEGLEDALPVSDHVTDLAVVINDPL